MAKPASIPDLLRVVRKSGLIELSHLEEFLQRQEETLPAPAQLLERLVADGLLTSFQAKHLLQGRYKGLILDKYKVLEMIGKGAHALVFLAEHVTMRRRVALKVLPAHLAQNPLELERFHREARAVAFLDHPNIVRAHDVNRSGQTHFLVMEYVDGQSLEDLVEQRGSIPYAEAAGYVVQVALGLQHAHERGVVHRDIKPANLLLNKNGAVKILDMGLAWFFEDDDTFTQAYAKGAVLGTADYIAPEQALNHREADIRSDIYSLGATFYRLVSGRTPFGGSWIRQKLMAHQLWNPQPLCEIQPDVPPELSAIVARMMAKKPEDRFQTPQEIAEVFKPWTAPRPRPAPAVKSDKPVPRRSPGRKWSRWVWDACGSSWRWARRRWRGFGQFLRHLLRSSMKSKR